MRIKETLVIGVLGFEFLFNFSTTALAASVSEGFGGKPSDTKQLTKITIGEEIKDIPSSTIIGGGPVGKIGVETGRSKVLEAANIAIGKENSASSDKIGSTIAGKLNNSSSVKQAANLAIGKGDTAVIGSKVDGKIRQEDLFVEAENNTKNIKKTCEACATGVSVGAGNNASPGTITVVRGNNFPSSSTSNVDGGSAVSPVTKSGSAVSPVTKSGSAVSPVTKSGSSEAKYVTLPLETYIALTNSFLECQATLLKGKSEEN